jgi:hypothetical protein
VIAGTASAVSGSVSRRQADKNAPSQPPEEAAPPPAPAAPEPAAPTPATAAPAVDPMEQLTKLAKLRDQGVLTDEEFAAQKAKLLDKI